MKPLIIRQLYNLTHLYKSIFIRPQAHLSPYTFRSIPSKFHNKQKDLTSRDVRSQHGGGLGIRTLATVTRPNDLANRPLQPLE